MESKQKAELLDKLGITAERVLREIAAIAFARVSDFAVVENAAAKDEDEGEGGSGQKVVVKIPEDTENAGAIREIRQARKGDVSIRMHDKLGALKLLGRYLGLFDKLKTAAEEDEFYDEPYMLLPGGVKVPI
jgi:phage terminase small subunit